MKHKKLWALLLAAVMVVGTMSGCASGEGNENASSGQAGNEASGSTGGAGTGGSTEGTSGTEEKVTISIGVVADALVENYETNLFTQMIEEDLNVDLEFVTFPTDRDEALTKLNLMISSNSELPDVLCMEILDDTTVYEFGSKGVLVPLDDYINDANVMKNFHSIDADAFEFMVANTKSPDGHTYALAAYAPWAWNEDPYRLWVNENWLEKLNLSMPETTEDFYNVLKAFVENDPNGNGINDEIGMVGAKDGWALNVIPSIMNAFIYANPDKSYLNVVDGKIVPSYTQDEWKEGLAFMKRLVDEGLLSPLSFTQDQNQLKALIQVEGGMAGFVPAGSYSTFGNGVGLEFDEMQLVPPLTGPEGACNTPYNPSMPVKEWYVTKDCENVDKAMEIGDWFYTERASMHSRFGEYGVDWDDDPEQTVLWKTRFDEDAPCTFYSYQTGVWGQLQNKHWVDRNPQYRNQEIMRGEGTIKFEDIPAEDEPLTQQPDFNKAFFASYRPRFPEEYIASLVYTSEESQSIAVSAADIINHVNTMNVAFITGNRSLDEWDAYLAELDAMGLENYISVVQTAYERSK